LSRIACDREIGRLQRREVRFPNFSTCGFTTSKRPVEPIGDGIADEKQINVALLCDVDKRLVSSVVPLVVKATFAGAGAPRCPAPA
jgi:hypothetical protein